MSIRVLFSKTELVKVWPSWFVDVPLSLEEFPVASPRGTASSNAVWAWPMVLATRMKMVDLDLQRRW